MPTTAHAWSGGRPTTSLPDLARPEAPVPPRRHDWRAVPRELGVVLAGVVVYFGVRGLTHRDPATAVRNAERVRDAEGALGIGVEDPVQSSAVWSDQLVDVANWVYIWGHWPVIAATLLWLVLSHRPVYVRTRDAMVLSGAVGMLVFAAFPVAPPRLAGMGLVDTVTEQSSAYRVLQPPAFVNQYAAMPSLHVGWDLLIGIAIVTAAARWWVRLVGVVLPLVMAWSVVATANHYLLDVVAGVVLVLAALGVVTWIRRERALRTVRRSAAAPGRTTR
jgi:membrane-associated phospholipid phosphatase